MTAVAAAPVPVARIGPNAVIQVAAALRAVVGEKGTRTIFAAADLIDHLDRPPATMIDETIIAALHRAVRVHLPRTLADRVMADAGRRTGEYILGRRIPAPVRVALPLLPESLAIRLLLAAIHRNAWTFTGSGRFSARYGKPVVLEIADNPLVTDEVAAAPVCHWHAAVFAVLFERLVAPGVTVSETACRVIGAASCQFEIHWH